MNKHESKYFNTASLFNETLITLLEEKDLEYITIKEICNKAGFNRSTFYLHYETIEDLLDETVNYITNKLIAHFNHNPKAFIEKITSSSKEDLNLVNESYLKPYLEFIKDNKKVFHTAFKNPSVMKSKEAYNNLEKYIFNPILDKYNIKEYKKKYLLEFYFNGIIGIIKEWTINDCKDDIETIMNIIIECVNGSK